MGGEDSSVSAASALGDGHHVLGFENTTTRGRLGDHVTLREEVSGRTRPSILVSFSIRGGA
jgi:hypothetical protein